MSSNSSSGIQPEAMTSFLGHRTKAFGVQMKSNRGNEFPGASALRNGHVAQRSSRADRWCTGHRPSKDLSVHCPLISVVLEGGCGSC
ncbi:hypothetical protein SRHO_G00040760 [Serrasalmus rhombeus]